MTFDQLKKQVKDYCNLTSQEADTRIGESLNSHYRRVTALIGREEVRFVTRTVTTTAGVQAVEFTEIEKIERVLDTTDSASIRLLREVSIHEQRANQPGAGQPSSWAPQSTGASTVTILLDAIPQGTYTLQADGTASLADLQGDDEPSFPESFHNVLSWNVISEELLKKEKDRLALIYQQKADKLQSELIFQLADSHTRDNRQGIGTASAVTGSGSGGSGTLGSTAYTQSALVTFDRGAGLAPFAVAQATAATVTNLDADKLDGEEGSFYLDRSNHTGANTTPVTDITPVTSDRLIGRDTAGDGAAEHISLDSTLEFTGSQSIRRAALTGDITAAAGSNTTTLRNSSSCSVIGRSANSTGATADIAAASNNQILARVSNALAFVGGLVPDGAGAIQQIAFAATQSASADANTLDDYEEGSWTPIVGGSGGQSSQGYTLQTGTYTKIGKLVVAQFQATLSSKGTITGTVVIAGLPFTVGAGHYTALMWDATVTSFGSVTALPSPGNTYAFVRASTAVATSSNGTLAAADVGNTTTFSGTIIYQATA